MSKGSSAAKAASHTMAESRVSGIIKSLGKLEDDLDSLNGRVGEMRRQLTVKAQSQIDYMTEKTREMAAKEAEVIINKSRAEATAESERITDTGKARLDTIKSAVDANFEGAVDDVVSTILKP